MELLTPPAMYLMITYTMIHVLELPTRFRWKGRARNQFLDRLAAYHEMFGATLHASRRRWAAQLAQLPIQPHRQLPGDGHFRQRRAATEL